MARHSVYKTNKFSSITAILIIFLFTAGIFLPMVPDGSTEFLELESEKQESNGYWSETTVGTSQGNLGKYPSIGIDENDVVHISHLDETSDVLMHSTNSSSSSWNSYAPFSSYDDVAGRSSLKIRF